jgi:hypothetical protein
LLFVISGQSLAFILGHPCDTPCSRITSFEEGERGQKNQRRSC